jgi:hypothetical protein|tara:strand:- start:378 stop:752 length:375 start_codon:yes stop_codon:yes gene_type:complete
MGKKLQVSQRANTMASQAQFAAQASPQYQQVPFSGMGVPQNFMPQYANQQMAYRPRAGSDIIKDIVFAKMAEMNFKTLNEPVYVHFDDQVAHKRANVKSNGAHQKKNLKVNSNVFKPSFVPKVL